MLARLPAEAPWRIGHFVRQIPDGYTETITSGHNVIGDPGVGAYYERLRVITEGRLLSRERLRTILRMNLGRYDHYLSSYGLVRVPFTRVSEAKPDGTPWTMESNIPMTRHGVEVTLEGARSGRALELSVSRNDRYRITLLEQSARVYETSLDQPMSGDSSLVTHTIDLPPNQTFDAVLLQPSGGDARYALGHLKVLPLR